MADGGARPRRRSGRFADVRGHPEVDSTNRVAADLARAGAPDGVVVLADHQTAGRGRRGRSWLAPPGSSLLVSVLLRPGPQRHPGPPAGGPPALTTVACSLAASDAVDEVAGFRPALRWPNDLYAGGRKLGGVLAEVVDGGAVVLGLGLNLRWPSGAPGPLAGRAVTAEEVAGRPVDRDELLAAFLVHLEVRDGALASDGGRRRILADYRDRCETLGRAVQVTLPGARRRTGVATAIDDSGHLVLDRDGTATVLSVGDVEHVATP
jgi:BirA family biotin operon repressor/biotin-[acetyl-CoA-carboxylase] ligase